MENGAKTVSGENGVRYHFEFADAPRNKRNSEGVRAVEPAIDEFPCP